MPFAAPCLNADFPVIRLSRFADAARLRSRSKFYVALPRVSPIRSLTPLDWIKCPVVHFQMRQAPSSHTTHLSNRRLTQFLNQALFNFLEDTRDPLVQCMFNGTS